jgi:hypothetical protein
MPLEYAKDSFSVYLNKKEYISASDIKSFSKSPRFYYYKAFEEVRTQDDRTGRHFVVGSGLHEVILEPHQFHENYIVAPKFDMRTTVGKQGYAEFKKTSEGKTLLFEDEFEMIINMGEMASKNDTFVELIKNSAREVSCYNTDEATGLKIRTRPDSLWVERSTITDLKSCLDSSPKKFRSDVYNLGYNVTAAFYMDFCEIDRYIFSALEKEKPNQMALYMLDDDLVQRGRETYRIALTLMKWCRENDYYPDYSEYEILKECLDLNTLSDFFDTKNRSEKIIILK